MLFNEPGNIDSFGTKRLEKITIEMEETVLKHLLLEQTPEIDITNLDNKNENELLLDFYDSLSSIRNSKDYKSKLSNVNRLIEQLCNYKKIIKSKLHIQSNQEQSNENNLNTFKETSFLSIDCNNTLNFDDYVSSISFSRDGKLIAIGSKGCIRIYNTDDYSKIMADLIINEKDVYFRTLCFTKDNRTLISGGEDCEIKIWNLETMKCESSLVGKSGEIYGLDITEDESILVSGTSDGNIDIWNLQNKTLIRNINVDDIITSTKILKDQIHFVVSCLKGNILVYEIESCKLVDSIDAKSQIHSLALSYKSNELAIGCMNHKIEVYNIEEGKKISSKRTLIGHNNLISSLCYLKYNDILVSGSRDKQLKFWFENNIQTSSSLFENTILSIDSSPQNNKDIEIVAIGCNTKVFIYSISLKQNDSN